MLYSAKHTIANPLTSDLPRTEFEALNYTVSLASETTTDTFVAAKQYMERLPVQMQVLFLMLLIRPLPVDHPIKNLPEYIEWYAHKDLQDFLSGK